MIPALTLAVSGSPAFAVSPATSGVAAPAPALEEALLAELSRARELSLPESAPPYVVIYDVLDGDIRTAIGEDGGLVTSSLERFRNLRTELRVGDYAFDSSNFHAFGEPDGVVSHSGLGQRACVTEPDDGRHIQTARAKSPLMTAAVSLGRQAYRFAALPHVKCAHALWPVELVGAQGRQIYLRPGHGQRNLACRLGGIGVEACAVGMGDPGDRRDGLDDAGFVVRCHHAHQPGSQVGHFGREPFEVQDPLMSDGDQSRAFAKIMPR